MEDPVVEANKKVVAAELGTSAGTEADWVDEKLLDTEVVIDVQGMAEATVGIAVVTGQVAVIIVEWEEVLAEGEMVVATECRMPAEVRSEERALIEDWKEREAEGRTTIELRLGRGTGNASPDGRVDAVIDASEGRCPMAVAF